jgi:hypothetical protein
VDELEQKLQEQEVLDDLRLERELAGLTTHESSLESREASPRSHRPRGLSKWFYDTFTGTATRAVVVVHFLERA